MLDAPALSRFATEDQYAQAVVWTSLEQGSTLFVPVTALALAWPTTPRAAHDAIDVLLGLPVTVIDPVDTSRAADIGDVLARAAEPDEIHGYWGAIAAAHLVALSRVRDWPIITDSTAYLHALDPKVEIKLLRNL